MPMLRRASVDQQSEGAGHPDRSSGLVFRKQEGLGDLYEGLLEKNAGEKRSGAGQYFTPRPLVDCMVQVLKPQAGEVIQDPPLVPAAL